MDVFFQQIYSTLIVVVVVLVVAGVMCFAKWRLDQKIRRRNRRTPLTRNMLRTPGETLRSELAELELDFGWEFGVAFFLPLLFCTNAFQIGRGLQPVNIALLVIVVIATTAVFEYWILRRIFKRMEKIRNLRLGLEGELASAEELNKLMLAGFHVYHDLPFQYGNIDHVVIGVSGVFAVETKARAKSNAQPEGHKVTVDHNKDGLRFADQNWKMPVRQMETTQRWLSQHLSEATGLSVNVISVLALPGYFIEKQIGSGKFKVINPVSCKRDFDDGLKRHSHEEVQRIAHQVEQLCRNVEPSFKGSAS